MNSEPATTMMMYISPSNTRVEVPNSAIYLYDRALSFRKRWLPSANFSSSSASLAKLLTTRMPSRLSSTWALISPTWRLRSRKVARNFSL